jgi:hypothetical protein
MYPITTGLNIELMDKFDRYRAAGVQLITTYEFAPDITIALRQQFNKDIDATVDAIAKNPRAAAVVVPPTVLTMPGITTNSAPVFVEQVVLPEVATGLNTLGFSL